MPIGSDQRIEPAFHRLCKIHRKLNPFIRSRRQTGEQSESLPSREWIDIIKTLSFRITESLGLDKTSKINSNHQPSNTTTLTTKPCPQVSHPHILLAFPGMVTTPLASGRRDPTAIVSSITEGRLPDKITPGKHTTFPVAAASAPHGLHWFKPKLLQSWSCICAPANSIFTRQMDGCTD